MDRHDGVLNAAFKIHSIGSRQPVVFAAMPHLRSQRNSYEETGDVSVT